MSKLLALDQSSKTSGYAIFNNSKLEEYGNFTFNDTDVGIRLTKIRQKIQELIKEYQIDEVIFEDIQQQTNVQTFKVLAEVYGVVSQLLTEMRIPHSAVLASSWKSTLHITGTNRAAQKQNAQKYVANTYSITTTSDEADAICIGTHYLQKENCAW